MQRITNNHLQAMCDRINRLTGSPMTYMDDNRKILIGHYHISGAYGGVSLHRTMNDGGGVTEVLRCGHVTKRDLYERMCAYIYGLEDSNKGE